ncbi:helix-hairpin-helix domain-containing protein [Bacillus massilinigeriensis]|uniref:helix-hairpin-helix domain-containing protein n=1 Tax=Bacillus mediterraneensis TaxID=1805474 RepID=UPI0008F971CB|nr:helix-hairpin-helix domain-containing protein [Bacillus mediterraneensis]
MKDWLKEHKNIILAALAAIVILSGSYFKREDEVQNLEKWPQEETSAEASAMGSDSLSTSPGGNGESREGNSIMMADIKGAVRNPGVYTVNHGDRVADLVKKAGGVTDEADTTSVNFAMKVGDEMAVRIPVKGESPTMLSSDSGGVNVPGTDQAEQINLNTATVAELDTLPGIGPSKAAAIVEYRETNGPFKSTEGLKEISGIGDKTFEKLAQSVTVN